VAEPGQLGHAVPVGGSGLPVPSGGAVLALQREPVSCHRCGHGYAVHQPACTSVETGGCSCAGFRWVDPAPTPDVRGYHRPRDLR
jgi:hypothetical protein